MNTEISHTSCPCGRLDIIVVGKAHPLCVACDTHVLYLSGLTDEDLRFKLWTDDPAYHRALCNCPECKKQRDEILKNRG